jgi:hypothetical protein
MSDFLKDSLVNFLCSLGVSRLSLTGGVVGWACPGTPEPGRFSEEPEPSLTDFGLDPSPGRLKPMPFWIQPIDHILPQAPQPLVHEG